MEADSNMVFNNDRMMNSRAISFQSGIMNSESGMIPFGNSVGIDNTAGLIVGGGSSKVGDGRGRGRGLSGSVSGSCLFYSAAQGISHDAGFVAEWSVEEQAKLEEGLLKYANEPNIMRYVKIATSLRDKAVRDVALRCWWMTNESGKRRKQEHFSGRKMKDKKETLAESSSKANLSLVQPLNMASYSFMMHHHMDPNNPITSEAVSNTAKHLLDENMKDFNKITANLTTFKHIENPTMDLHGINNVVFVGPRGSLRVQIHDNIDLLCRTRKNLIKILKEMREVPGIMSQMPPLPVTINEELADIFLPGAYQVMFGLPRELHLKREPRC